MDSRMSRITTAQKVGTLVFVMAMSNGFLNNTMFTLLKSLRTGAVLNHFYR